MEAETNRGSCGSPDKRSCGLARAGALGMERNGAIEKHLGGRGDSVCDRLDLGKPRREGVLLPSNPWFGQPVDGGAVHRQGRIFFT